MCCTVWCAALHTALIINQKGSDVSVMTCMARSESLRITMEGGNMGIRASLGTGGDHLLTERTMDEG